VGQPEISVNAGFLSRGETRRILRKLLILAGIYFSRNVQIGWGDLIFWKYREKTAALARGLAPFVFWGVFHAERALGRADEGVRPYTSKFWG
jgi:hypothetical protein